MKLALATIALAATLITGCGAATAANTGPAPVSSPDYLTPTGAAVAPEPLEDEAGWDCAKHGNKSCDAIDIHGTPEDEGEAIDPAELAELAAADAAVANGAPAITDKQEDEPGWDCYADGNRICGPQAEKLTVEAWDKFTVAGFPAATLSQAFKVTYRGTVQAGADLPPSQFHTIASSKAGISHVFSVEVLK